MLSFGSGCAISIPRRDPLPPNDDHAARLHAADIYCLKVGGELDNRRVLRGVRTGSTIALAGAGLVTVISGLYFADAARDDSPDASKLETRGTVALASAVVTALAGVIYAGAKQEYDARRESSREINKAHALAESAKLVMVEKRRTPSEYTQAEKGLPAQLVESCYAIADRNEERGQKAVESMISEASNRAAEVLRKRNNIQEECSEADADKCTSALHALFPSLALKASVAGGEMHIRLKSPPANPPPAPPPPAPAPPPGP